MWDARHKFCQRAYQVLQLFWITVPGWYILSSFTHGHIEMGTHWLQWSCTSPGGHWQPGTHILRPIPPLSSQLQPCCRSEQEPPHARPHSWYTWPPEHWTAGEKGEVVWKTNTRLVTGKGFSVLIQQTSVLWGPFKYCRPTNWTLAWGLTQSLTWVDHTQRKCHSPISSISDDSYDKWWRNK